MTGNTRKQGEKHPAICKHCQSWHSRPTTSDYGDCDNDRVGFNWTQMEHGRSALLDELEAKSKVSIGYTEENDIVLWTGANFGCVHFH